MNAAMFFFSTLAVAFTILSVDSSALDLCSNTWADFQNRLKFPHNRLAFRNDSGPLDIGMCWWHTRMQRNANFLLDFRPELPKPAGTDLWLIIQALADTGRIIVVPGFENLRQFSATYKNELNETLAQWQLVDTFLGFNWINGLQGSPHIPPQELENKMDRLYHLVKIQRQVVYQMLNLQGVSSHALLVIDMTFQKNGDYILDTVDSNFLNLQQFVYHRGSDRIESRYGGFVPYVQRTSDLADFQRVISWTCGIWGQSSRLSALY